MVDENELFAAIKFLLSEIASLRNELTAVRAAVEHSEPALIAHIQGTLEEIDVHPSSKKLRDAIEKLDLGGLLSALSKYSGPIQ